MSRPQALGPLTLAGIVLIAGGAVAAGLGGAEAAKAREQHMKSLGAASKAIFEQVKTGAPDIAVVKVNAAKIDAAAHELPTWFPAGSGQPAIAKSEALPLVWTDAAGFAVKAKALETAAGQLSAVAQAGDAAGVPAAFKAVGAACKGCHETYKAKDKA
jgi:cytochrome c556